MKKTIISLVILAISVMLLASCNNSVDTTPTVSPVLTTNEPAVPSPSPSPSLGIEIPFEAANYHTSKDFGTEDWIAYINSPEELAAYYSEYGTDGKLDTMKDKVFLNEKYDEAFFNDKCLMLYYHYEPCIRKEKYISVTVNNNVLTINIQTNKKASQMITFIHTVIELDKQYSGMDASLHWETQEIE